MDYLNENRISFDKYLALIKLSVIAVILLPLPIISIAVGKHYPDETCQKPDFLDINLSQWLQIINYFTIGVYGIFLLSYLIIKYIDNKYFFKFGVALIGLLVLVTPFFYVLFTIFGIIILYDTNIDCLNDGNILGIMTLINIVFYLFILLIIFLKCLIDVNKNHSIFNIIKSKRETEMDNYHL